MNLELVRNEGKYHEFIRRLRNENKAYFIGQEEITPEAQRRYMAQHGNCYHVCLCDGQPCGYVGCVNGDLRFCVDRPFRAQGVASFMVAKLTAMIPGMTAKVKGDNPASLKTLLKAGYQIDLYLLSPAPASAQQAGAADAKAKAP